jgi:malonyl-CoA O-methyltransferase
MGLIDKKKVMRSFGRQAREYDSNSLIQKKVIERFIGLLRTENIMPERLLDIGVGTGTLLRLLRGLYPEAIMAGIDLAPEMCLTARQNAHGEKSTHFIAADAERLPFADASFNLVLSTSTFQWLNSLDHAFTEALRLLAPGGLFCFALFGENTLHELKFSYRLALVASGRSKCDRSHRFFSKKEVEVALGRAGFACSFLRSETYPELHEDVPSLLRSLKKIGAGNASPVTSAGLSGKRFMQTLMDMYRRNYGMEGLVPATYEVVYAMGRKPSAP